MEEDPSVSTLPWSWVVEALAKSKLVDATFLHELVSEVPPLSGYSGKQAREAAALRCLEGLFAPDVSSENHEASKIGIDPTESCEATLQHILSETSGSKGASDELKWNVHSFVKHKKANSPRSTLELLKDVILEETHPLAASLKEISGHVIRDQCVLNIPFDGGEPISPSLRRDEDDHADKIMLAEEYGCFPKSGVCDQPVEAYTNGNSLPCRGDIDNLHTDNHVPEIAAASHDIGSQCPPEKKRKMDKEYDMKSMQQNSVPVVSDEMCNVADDGQYREVIEANKIHDGTSHRKEADEQDKEYVGNHDGQLSSINNSDHCCEEIDLAMNNPNLSPQFAVDGDLLAMTDTEPKLCMKCNKDGHLLSCSASSCPLLFHEGCLGSSVRFDDQGNFYCPFCAYSHAISEYVKAKEKVSSRRKELSLFIGGKVGDQSEQDGISSGDDVDQDKHDVGEKRAEPQKGANDIHKGSDNIAEVKKGASVVAQAANLCLRNLEGKQVELSHSSAEKDGNGNVMAAQVGEIIIHLSRNQTQNWNQEQGDVAKLSGNNELQNHGETTRCKIKELHGDASSESISDADELLQHKRNHDVSSMPSPTPLRSVPRTPQGRRKKAPWTKEEEETLKKGVELFVQQDRTIPWKNILEYGSSVYLKGRTAIDLKDKWRNMTRGSSPKV